MFRHRYANLAFLGEYCPQFPHTPWIPRSHPNMFLRSAPSPEDQVLGWPLWKQNPGQPDTSHHGAWGGGRGGPFLMGGLRIQVCVIPLGGLSVFFQANWTFKIAKQKVIAPKQKRHARPRAWPWRSQLCLCHRAQPQPITSRQRFGRPGLNWCWPCKKKKNRAACYGVCAAPPPPPTKNMYERNQNTKTNTNTLIQEQWVGCSTTRQRRSGYMFSSLPSAQLSR